MSEVIARWVLTAQLLVAVTNGDEILTVETALHILTPQFIHFLSTVFLNECTLLQTIKI